MLGQPIGGTAGSSANRRIFVYEVKGLRQNDQTDKTNYQVRNSGTTSFQVPYNRMNDETRRITRLGGQIVNIYPLGDNAGAAAAEA